MKKQPKEIVQPDKGVGCKLDPEVYQGIAAGLGAGRTVADLARLTAWHRPPCRSCVTVTSRAYRRLSDAWQLRWAWSPRWPLTA